MTGTDSDATSRFLPMVAKRMVGLFPKLANLKVRRTWRGQYQMTPDGLPIIGPCRRQPNFINAVGMCGQGFMLGPGVGELVARMVLSRPDADDPEVLRHFAHDRNFSQAEQFK